MRWLVVAIAGVVLLVTLATVILRLRFNGPALADTIEIILNSDIRGRVEIESVEWPLESLPTLVTGGWIPIEIRGLRVYDDGGMLGEEVANDRRELLLETDRVTAEIDAHSLILGHHDFTIRNLVIPDGGYVLLREVAEPYPLHLYDSTIVSLASAFYSRLELGFRAGLTATSAKVFDIRDFDIRGVTVEIIYPGAHLIVENASATGFVRSDYSDPLKLKVYYALAPVAQRGVLCIGEVERDRELEEPYRSIKGAREIGILCPDTTVDGKARVVYKIPLVDIEISRLAQMPTGWPRDTIAHDVEWSMSARTPAGSLVNLDGALRDYWIGYYGGDFDVTMDVDNGGPLMELLTDELTGGDNVRLRARVTGPSIGPKVAVDIENLDIRVLDDDPDNPLDLHLDRASATFDLVTEQGSLENTVARGANGRVRLSAFYGLDPFNFNLQAEIEKPIDMRPWTPPDVVELLGDSATVGPGRLAGDLEISGDGIVQMISPLNLRFGQARITGKLFARDSRVVNAEPLEVRVGDTRLTARGTMDIVDESFDLDVALQSRDLPTRLKRFGLPALARGATGRARVRGTADDPQAHAKLDFTGVELLRKVRVDMNYADQDLTLNEVTSNGLDGTLRASGRIRMGPKPRLLDFEADAKRLDLGRIPSFQGLVTGRVDARASARGDFDRLDAAAKASFDGFTIAGDKYEFSEDVNYESKPDGSQKFAFTLNRAGGGSLGTNATIDPEGRLAGTLLLDAAPLQQLGILGGVRYSPVGGDLSTELTLGGTLDAPTARGDLHWLRAWFDQTFLGAGSFRIEEYDVPGHIHVVGTLLQGDMTVDAIMATQAPYNTELTLQLRRVELDRFAPDMAARLGMRGWVSGEVKTQLALSGEPDQPMLLTANLDEVEVWIDNQDQNGRSTPIQVRNKSSTPLRVSYNGKRLALEAPVTLIGPGGAAFDASGHIDDDRLALSVKGDIDLTLLTPYLREYVTAIEGKLGVDVKVTGTMQQPIVDATVLVGDARRDIVIQPIGQDTLISIVRGGLIKMNNTSLAPTNLKVVVTDPYIDETSTLTLAGGVTLQDFKPTLLGLTLSGELSGKLLSVFAPAVFSRAGGKVKVEGDVRGTLDDPKPSFEIQFATASPLTMTPRGLRRELRFTRGEIFVEADGIEITDLTGTVDDEGAFRNINGLIQLSDWEPTKVQLTAAADTVSYRMPDNLDLTLNVRQLTIKSEGEADRRNATGEDTDLPPAPPEDQLGDDVEFGSKVAGLVISGDVEVVDGRYIRDFNLIQDALIPESSGTSTSSGKSVYDDIPLLGDARLALHIGTRGFFVQNNLADIQLMGQVDIAGTVRKPKLDGEIRVSQGEFKLPGIRARFTRTRGSVSFSQFQDFPEDTPTLNLTSESDYRDPSGQEHLVTLNITGPLSALDWDLYTSSGLNKGQTVTMLFSGRTPEELRKSLGDDALGRDPSRIEASTAPSENAADQLLKDLAGDFISLLIEDKLRNLTSLDVARLEIGTGSIGFHAEKELLENLHLYGDLEQTLRGRTYDLRGELRFPRRVSLESEYLTKDFEDDSEEDISELRVRAVWRWLWY